MKMKKCLFSYALFLFSLFLSGCEIHFADGTRYDVPWWFVFCFITLPFLILGTILFISQMPKNFWAVCNKCHTKFYVKKRVFSFNSATPEHFEFVTKCPHCGEKRLCTKSYNQDD